MTMTLGFDLKRSYVGKLQLSDDRFNFAKTGSLVLASYATKAIDLLVTIGEQAGGYTEC